MECRYATQVMLFWSGELSYHQHNEMEQHLRTCRVCQDMLNDLEEVEQAFSALPLIKPERSLLRAAVETQSLSEKRWFRWFPVPAVQLAAFFAITCILGIWYASRQTTLSPLKTPQRVAVSFASHVDRTLAPQMSELQNRMCRLKERMGGEPQNTRRRRTVHSTNRVLSHVRSDVKELKRRLIIIKQKQFPFRNILNIPGRETNESNTRDHDNRCAHHDWYFCSLNHC